ncbi:MAG: hypothetical protein HON98_04405 [Chloroflexi bacterium]|mgnify:FL=1|jgi:cell division protein FtsI/penicillin-binding protein 2|nr:hypothetical protein [Chloroflexota bacterium]MBT3671220.1 hypothetical protein [Chloroflexota bacterium]MBT4003540.1 hypothetical protein [Chloroflexota bacterium]MBT4304321.1 hypothetical protein [Chloroflexota bacterium]MBT4534340.1 hypothetical protein [Chloroflexota bacterium]
MKTRFQKIIILSLILIFALQACANNNTPTNEGGPTTTPTLGQPEINTTTTPDPSLTAEAYLDAWGKQDYSKMYAMLTKLSQDSYSFEEFELRYQEVYREGSLFGIAYEIQQELKNPSTAQVGYKVILNSALVGEITRETRMNLSLENGAWHVVWDDTLILPELAGGNLLSMQVYPPTRGILYDQEGDPLAGYSEAVALRAIPSNVDEDSVDGFINQLAAMTGISAGVLELKILAEDAEFLVPITELPAEVFDIRAPFLEPYNAMYNYENYFTRLYYLDEGGANSIGYVSSIPADEVDFWAERGYPIDAQIGRLGIEGWGEEYLSGQRGGELYVVDSERTDRITILGSRDSSPSESIYTTLDDDLQLQTQLALGDFTGAAVVIELDTGRILAIASSPTFNPNHADFNNPNSQWGSYFDGSTNQPFLNRATQGQYPPGSIFKVITAAAAIESGEFQAETRYYCGQIWTDIGIDLFDWTLDKELPPSGDLNLPEALMRSCNPWFYHIGHTLGSSEETINMVAEMARGFGLGSATGQTVLPEAEGLISNPAESTTGSQTIFNAVQQAIGQSDTLITPLQAAVYTAALGNGGTLYQPQIIERVENTAGESSMVFEPIINGSLPISPETLGTLQYGMRLVVSNPRGTAYRTFANFFVPVYGKTGTAQNSGPDAHAWFIGYTQALQEENPDIAVIVLVENIGDGSEFAAPIFSRIVESYFLGQPQRRYPWEEKIGKVDPEYFNPPEETEVVTP